MDDDYAVRSSEAPPSHEPDEPPGGTPVVRASDAERADTVSVLHGALGEGRLDLAETESRVGDAYAARHRHELSALLADLPGDGSPASSTDAPSWAAIAESLAWRARITFFGGSAAARPDRAQLWAAAGLVAAAVAWFLLCAVLGVAAVAA